MTRKVVAVAGMALVHKHGLTIQAIKQWREQQQESGLPSSLEDFYRAHGFCWACRSEGALLVGVRWTDEDGNQHTASMGTDAEPVGIAQLVREHNLRNGGPDGHPWEYLWDPCEVCHGTGKN